RRPYRTLLLSTGVRLGIDHRPRRAAMLGGREATPAAVRAYPPAPGGLQYAVGLDRRAAVSAGRQSLTHHPGLLTEPRRLGPDLRGVPFAPEAERAPAAWVSGSDEELAGQLLCQGDRAPGDGPDSPG